MHMCEKPHTKQGAVCFGHIIKFHYNSYTGSCHTVVYGGCFATENNFETEEECWAACAEYNKTNIYLVKQ